MKELRMPIQILSKALLSQLLVSAVEDTEIYDELKKFKTDYSRYINYNEIHENISWFRSESPAARLLQSKLIQISSLENHNIYNQ